MYTCLPACLATNPAHDLNIYLFSSQNNPTQTPFTQKTKPIKRERVTNSTDQNSPP